MGGNRLVAVFASVTLGCSACSDGAQAAVHEDTMVLEVGGAHGSLRQALAARGIVIAPPQHLRDDDIPNGPSVEPRLDQPAHKPQPVENDSPAPQPQPEPPPQPGPQAQPPAATYRIVELGRHQNLIQLSKQYLGTGNRFREIMALNGWTDADTRRLPEGQKVKIPIDPPR